MKLEQTMTKQQSPTEFAVPLERLDSADVVRILKARFIHERISQHFQSEDCEFIGTHTRIDTSNSLLLSFTVAEDSQLKRRNENVVYRLSILLGLRSEREYPGNLYLDLSGFADKYNLDRTIIWSCEPLDPTIVRLLKKQKVEVMVLTASEQRGQTAIPFFLPLPQKTHEYDVAVNAAADLLTKRLKKLFHLVLSEVAAPIYDSLYGKERVATRETMAWEENEIGRIADHLRELGRTQLAIDVGCGTGRHTFPLAERFSEVYAFDFSPEMIKQARQIKKEKDNRNIFFDTIDIEYEDVPSERVFSSKGEGRADLVVSSFGMGSFVEDTVQLLRRIHSWLRPGGYTILSFYNADSLLLNVTPNWRDTSLSAHLDMTTKTLRVELSEDTVFHIFCQPFSEDIRSKINSVFEIECIETFPSIMALMPNSLLSKQPAAKLFSHVDRVLSAEWELRVLLEDLARRSLYDEPVLGKLARLQEILLLSEKDPAASPGYYVLVVARKTSPEGEGYSRVISLLKKHNCNYEIIEHLPVQSIREVMGEVKEFAGDMIKTVVFKYRTSKRLYAVVLPAHKRIDKKFLAQELAIKPGPFVYAPERDILKLGFPLGGLAPFGFEPSVSVVHVIDKEIRETQAEWLYTGVGDNTKTLKIKREDFLTLVSDYKPITITNAV